MRIDNIAFKEIMENPLNQQEQDLRIPHLKAAFQQEAREVSVMELLGPDLRILRRRLGHKPMSEKTIMQIGLSLLTAYEQIHRSGWLHLTTKPINFCIGGTAGTRHKIYAVDFGRAQSYLSTDENGTKVHRKQFAAANVGFLTNESSSIWSDLRLTASRRDDIMSSGIDDDVLGRNRRRCYAMEHRQIFLQQIYLG